MIPKAEIHCHIEGAADPELVVAQARKYNVDVSDIMMVPSVTDIAGLNRLSRVILSNAAQALLGMIAAPATPSVDDKPAVGLSMFGVTTPSVTQTAELLRDRFDCLVFHATGTGGRAMERLAADGVFCASAFRYASPPASSALPALCSDS